MPPVFRTYLNDIERFFTLVRMSGFVLSPRDVEKVRQYYLRGVPIQVVMEGILEGAKAFRYKAAPGERPPHNLSFYGHYIGSRVRSYRAPSRAVLSASEVGTEEEAKPWLEQLVTEMELLVMQEERPLERGVKEEALVRLREAREELADEEDEELIRSHLESLDDEILALYHSRLDAESQGGIVVETERLLAVEQTLSPRAREARRRVLSARVLRERLKLLEFGG